MTYTYCLFILTRLCSQRRIKCDEGKPACKKCTGFGRTCAGYQVPREATLALSKSHRTLQPKNDPDVYSEAASVPTLQIRPWYWILKDLSPEEGLALTFFRHHTARELKGWSESCIWERWAMQLSVREPTILHGLIAVGALHRLIVENDQRMSSNVENDKKIALQCYGKSIVDLRRSISSQRADVDATVVLQACLILFCFEMLRDEGTIAMQHLHAGLRILGERIKAMQNTGSSESTSVRLSTSPYGPLEELVAAYAMLDFDNAMFSFQRLELPLRISLHGTEVLPSASVPSRFRTPSQARACLNILGNEAFQLLKELSVLAERAAIEDGFVRATPRFWCYVHTLSHSVDLGHLSADFHDRKSRLHRQIREFAKALSYLAADEKGSDRQNDRTLLALEVQSILLQFHIANSRSTHETDCDAFNSNFKRAVDLAERYIDSAPSFTVTNTSRQRRFALEPGVVPMLCLVGAKCRFPSTRHRAIRLLKRSGLQEALWNSAAFSTFVERLAVLEEETAVRLTGKRSREELHLSSDIPEQARFTDINLVRIPDQPWRSKLLCARYAQEENGRIVFFEEYISV
jgi:hypothetical protein